MKSMIVRAFSGAAMIALAAGAAHAQNLITNGGFETGDFTGWSTNVQSGSSGNLYVHANDGTSVPSSLPTAVNPIGGNFFAVTDQSGPGSYSLTQAFTLSSSGTVNISFDLFANNYAGNTYANGRDFTVSPNENEVVDILKAGADAFTNDPNDIVAVLFGPGTAASSWGTVNASLNLAAGNYVFRFAETDNQSNFTAGLDNVSVIGGAVPEPASWAMMLGGFGLVGGAMRRRRTAVRFA